MASTIANLTLTLGVLSVPLKLTAAARATDGFKFNLLHSCGSRITRKDFCPACNKAVERTELHKGYEYEKDKYVTVTDEELEACAPESSSELTVTSTVKASEIDPLLFDASYYLAPSTDKKKNVIGGAVYNLISQTLTAANLMAVAKVYLHGREHTVIIRSTKQGGLALHTLFYQDEVRDAPTLSGNTTIKPAELKLGRQLLEGYLEPFDHSDYSDSYVTNVHELLKAKQASTAGKKQKLARKPPSTTADLMSALQASINVGKPKAAKKKAA